MKVSSVLSVPLGGQTTVRQVAFGQLPTRCLLGQALVMYGDPEQTVTAILEL